MTLIVLMKRHNCSPKGLNSHIHVKVLNSFDKPILWTKGTPKVIIKLKYPIGMFSQKLFVRYICENLKLVTAMQ